VTTDEYRALGYVEFGGGEQVIQVGRLSGTKKFEGEREN